MSKTIRAKAITNVDQCSYCGNVPLEFHDNHYENGSYVQSWFCTDCGAEGHDWYDMKSRVITHTEAKP